MSHKRRHMTLYRAHLFSGCRTYGLRSAMRERVRCDECSNVPNMTRPSQLALPRHWRQLLRTTSTAGLAGISNRASNKQQAERTEESCVMIRVTLDVVRKKSYRSHTHTCLLKSSLQCDRNISATGNYRSVEGGRNYPRDAMVARSCMP